ncbi:unnamed protein product [Calicophoron daubneyi]|uniref:Charged multivesicular body protein 7 n=1 Tax=Calicophoron daubneyi TaxID=300641 RepID=A0AAV2TAX0_CALDB
MTEGDPAPSEFILPSIWDDDDSMFALMQPLKRPKHVDPEKYQQKIGFWSDLLLKYVQQQRVLVVSERALESVFSRYFPEEHVTLTPKCLGETLHFLEENQNVKPYTSGWGYWTSVLSSGLEYFVKKPLVWTFRSVLGDISNAQQQSGDPDSLFVFHKLGEEVAEEFIDWFNRTKSDKRIYPRIPVYTVEEFEGALATFVPHEASRSYIRQICSNNFRCIRKEQVSSAGDQHATEVVRVSESSTSPLPRLSRSEEAQTESAVLAGLVHIKTVISQLEEEEQKITTEIEERRTRVKALLADKRIREAKNLLRRAKILEKSLEMKQNQLQNLESMQLQIESASDNQTVLRALADSSRALQTKTGGAAGLAVVEETMNDVAESMQDSNELSDLISSFARTSVGATESDDLEAELKELLGPDKAKQKPILPSPPRADKGLDEEALEAELAALDANLPDVPEGPIMVNPVHKKFPQAVHHA